MSDKILNKEVKLREEAMRKFVEVEKMLQREESIRLDFEKKMREDSEVRLDSLLPLECYTIPAIMILNFK